MTETNETETKRALGLNRPGRLELKKTIDAGMVKQSFSHGRTKQVSVEVKKKRTFTRGETSGELTEAPAQEASRFAQPARTGPAKELHHGLSDIERLARQRALEGAQARHHDSPAPPIDAKAVEMPPPAPPVEPPTIEEPEAEAPHFEAKAPVVEELPRVEPEPAAVSATR